MPTPTLNQAIAAIRAGRRAEGRAVLQEILAAEPRNIPALLWMTEVSGSLAERRAYLMQILAIDPQNAAALKGLEMLKAAGETAKEIARREPPRAQPEILKARETPRPIVRPEPVRAQPETSKAPAVGELPAGPAPSSARSVEAPPQPAVARKRRPRPIIFLLLSIGGLILLSLGALALSSKGPPASLPATPTITPTPTTVRPPTWTPTPSPTPQLTPSPTPTLSKEVRCAALDRWINTTTTDAQQMKDLLAEFGKLSLVKSNTARIQEISTEADALYVFQSNMEVSPDLIGVNSQYAEVFRLYAQSWYDVARGLETGDSGLVRAATQELDRVQEMWRAADVTLASMAKECGIEVTPEG